MARTLGSLAVALSAVVIAAGPAAAETNGRISDVQPAADATISLIFSASGLPADVFLDPASVTVAIDNTSVESTAAPLESEAQIDRSAILVIDTSGSMKDAKIAGAKAAATSFLDTAPKDIKIGLVSFNDKAEVVVTPTVDRAQVKAAVSALNTGGKTALYDATIVASEALGTSGSRNLLLLSDGGDSSSTSSSADAIAAIAASGVTLDAVALSTNSAQIEVLADLAGASGGTVVSTTQADDLAAAFEASARALGNQLSVLVTVPAELASSGSTLTVSAKAGDQTITDTAFVPIPGAPKPSGSPAIGASGPILVSEPALYDRIDEAWLWTGLALLFAGLAIMLVVGFVRASRRRSTSVRGRMSIYTLGGRTLRKESETTTTALGDTQVAKSAVELAGRAVRGRNLEELLERRLDAAGLPFKPGEWALIHVGIAVGSGLLLLLLTSGRIAASLLGLALGVIVPWIYLGRKESRRQAAFYEQLPDTLQLISGSLSAGYSLPQAVDTVVREGSNPMAAEFSRALIEARLGVPIEEALDNIADRMNSQDFHWVVLAIRVQREVGGNLAEVLTNVAATLRERERLRRQVQVLSAEGRLSAVIIALIPILFAVFLFLTRPEYLEPLYSTSLGLLMLGFAVLMLVVGIFWMRRVVKVEV